MRLIDTLNYQIIEFPPPKIPDYAILSHTWGQDEYLFTDRHNPSRRDSAGFRKIFRCCALAASHGYRYLWVDTCCIDKTSSAELTESINSMYKWYQKSEICYVYVADFALQSSSGSRLGESFRNCRWFTRGWTLQELLAPKQVIFYDSNWLEIGSRKFLQNAISYICRISTEHMEHPERASIAIKMSWASHRETSREEDIAYSLLGLFDVHMPLIYGEGKNAFYRLQCELIQSSSDESIFAWWEMGVSSSGLLAESPWAFTNSNDIVQVSVDTFERAPYHMTNNGLAIDLYCHQSPIPDSKADEPDRDFFTTLACARKSNISAPIVLKLRRRHKNKASRIQCHGVELDKSIEDKSGPLVKWSLYVKQERSLIEPLSQYLAWQEKSLPMLVTLTSVAQSRFTLDLRLCSPVESVEIMDDGSFSVPSYFICGLTKLVFQSDYENAFTFTNSGRFAWLSAARQSQEESNCTRRYISKNGNLSIRIDHNSFLWMTSRIGKDESDRLHQMVIIDVTPIDRSRVLKWWYGG